MSKKRTSRRPEAMLTTESIKESPHNTNAVPDDEKRPDGVLGTDSIQEIESDDSSDNSDVIEEVEMGIVPVALETTMLTPEEEIVVAQILGNVPVVAPQRKKYYGNEMGPAERVVFKPSDPTACHDLELLLNDGSIYVIRFTNGRATVPQQVAEYIRSHLPPGRLAVAD